MSGVGERGRRAGSESGVGERGRRGWVGEAGSERLGVWKATPRNRGQLRSRETWPGSYDPRTRRCLRARTSPTRTKPPNPMVAAPVASRESRTHRHLAPRIAECSGTLLQPPQDGRGEQCGWIQTSPRSKQVGHRPRRWMKARRPSRLRARSGPSLEVLRELHCR